MPCGTSKIEGLQAFQVFTFVPGRFKKLEESKFNSRDGIKIDSEG
jgi:hypothetical protein